jgi:NifU-like protein involved in Fe-S cluster formation
MPYSPRVLDYCNNPRCAGSLPAHDPDVCVGVAQADGCDDLVRLYLRLDPSCSRILEARFQAFGCAAAIASASRAAERFTGLTVEEALRVRNADIAVEMDLPAEKHHAVLAEEALRAALQRPGLELAVSDDRADGRSRSR